MNWEEAERLGWAGERIRRDSTFDRLYDYQRGAWRFIPWDNQLRQEGIPRIVQGSADFSLEDACATNWTTDPVPPQKENPTLGVWRCYKIIITSQGAQDDNLRIIWKTTVVSDEKWNVASYFGEVCGAPNSNPNWQMAGFRIITLESSVVVGEGGYFRGGDNIEVDVYNGGGGWRTNPWIATIYWEDGETTTATGGVFSVGSSAAGVYVPNGGFNLVPPVQ